MSDFTYIHLVDAPDTVGSIPSGATGVHESVLFSYQLLNEVVWMLGNGAPPVVVLRFISAMRGLNKGSRLDR